MNKTLHILVVALFLLSTTAAEAYPLYFKIHNPRSHSIFIQSDSRHLSIEIPPKESREIVVVGPSEWHVRYSTGLIGNVKWTLDKRLDHFIENDCKECMEKSWDDKTVKYCTLRVDDTGVGDSKYILTVVEIRDLGTSTDEVLLSNNEKAMLVFASVVPLVAMQVLMAAKTIYIEKSKI